MPKRRFQRGRIFKRGHNRHATWVLAYRDDVTQPDGTIRRKQRKVVLGLAKHMTKADAAQVAQPLLDAVNATAPLKHAAKTLSALVEEWEKAVSPMLKPSTERAAHSHLRNHILPALGDKPLSAVSTHNVQLFVSEMAAKGLSRKSIENVLQTLLSIVKTAKKWHYVHDVFERADLSLPREREKRDTRFYTAEQAQRIIAASEEPYATMYALLAVTGCRAGEVLALKRGDLDFDRRILKIRRTLDSATRLIHAPKSRASSADLPMPDGLAQRIRNFLAHHWQANPDDLLFANSKGKPMQRDKIAYKLQKTLRELGIEKAALHAFRHMQASELLESGAAPSVVQRQMRHSDARITLQRYSHIIGDAQRKAVNSLSERVLSA